MLDSINNKLSILEILHADIKKLKASLEYTQSQIETLQVENKELKHTVNTLTTQVETMSNKNKTMKETILDLQSSSMHDNLIFTGIKEQPEDNPKQAIKEFMQSSLKLPHDTVHNITFHRVHRIGAKSNSRPRSIVAKFELFKQKELVKSRGRELKGTTYGMNDQFPREIQERRKKLLPILREYREKGRRVALTVDRLYIDGQLYRDRNVTTWP